MLFAPNLPKNVGLVNTILFQQGKGDVLTEDRMKRLYDSRIERYMSEKRSPANQANNNIDCNTYGSEIKCDTHWEYSVPSGISSDSETKSSQLNRPPL